MTEVNKPFQCIHVDLIGRLPSGGHRKAEYILAIIDDYSKYLWTFDLVKKSEAADVLIALIKRIERAGDFRLSILKADQGGEFRNQKLQKFCSSNGIQLRFSPSRHPELNGAIERQNRSVQEAIISMLVDAKLTKWFWPWAMNWYKYTYNRTGTRMLKFKTPFEKFYARKPDVSGFIVFGSRGFGLDRIEKPKLTPRGRSCRFLGFSSENRSYIVWWQDTNQIGYCRSAIFEENLDRDIKEVKTADITLKSILDDLDFNGVDKLLDTSRLSHEKEDSFENSYSGSNPDDVAVINAGTPSDDHDDQSSDAEKSETNLSQINFCDPNEVFVIEGKRNRTQTKRYSKLIKHIIKKALKKLSKLNDPKSFVEIQFTDEAEKWLKSYLKELLGFEKIAGCKIIARSEVPNGAQVLPLMELFKTKLDGTKKVRFVVRGDLQIDPPTDIYGPTASEVGVKLIISFAAFRNLKLHQLDIQNAYLNGRSDTPTYIELPQGHKNKVGKKFVYKTYASIYGLKSSPKIWNEKLNDVLFEYGLKPCPVEPCIYTGRGIYLLIYVDDLLYCGDSQNDIDEFEAAMKAQFQLTVEAEVRKFLGIQIEEKEDGILIHQADYCNKIVETFGMADAVSAKIPILPNLDLEKVDQEPMESAHLFQALLGSLLFLNLNTRPDLCFAVNYLSRRAKSPREADFKALKGIVRYLKDHATFGIFYKKAEKNTNSVEIGAVVDSSYASGPRRKSISGILINVNGGPVFFRTKTQSFQAESTTEAEFEAIQIAGRELLCVRNVLQFLGQDTKLPMPIENDNQGALAIARSSKSVRRTRHIELNKFYVQDMVRVGVFWPVYVQTSDLSADMLTKGLPRVKFQKFRDEILYKFN